MHSIKYIFSREQLLNVQTTFVFAQHSVIKAASAQRELQSPLIIQFSPRTESHSAHSEVFTQQGS